MHRTGSFLKHFYYGFNPATFFLRLDFDQELLVKEKSLKIRLNWEGKDTPTEQNITRGSFGDPQFPTFRFCVEEILELGIGWEDLQVKEREELHFSISVIEEDFVLERWPPYGSFRVRRPTKDFESAVWSA